MAVGRALLALCAAVLAASACSAESDSAGPAERSAVAEKATPPPLRTPTVGAVRVVTSGKQITLPLDAYFPDPAEVAVVTRGYDVVFRGCVSRFGLEVPPVASGEVERSGNERRYGLLDLKEAAAHGYVGAAGPAKRQRPREEAASPQLVAVATGEGQATVNGRAVPEGGCRAEATRIVEAGAPVAEESLLPELINLTSYWAERHPQVTAAFAAWSRCMAAAGYTYDNPWQPNDNPKMREPGPKDEYVKTAVADVACKHKTNLAGVWMAVDSAYQRDAIADNRAALEAVRVRRHVQFANASKALNGSRG
jgi:hypothetical protein